MTDRPAPPPRARLLRAARASARCWAGVIEDEASLRASSLAYSVLFCAAPIFAMLLGFSSMFPKAFSFLPRLYAEISPRVLPAALAEVAASLRGYADNAANLSVASLALFVLSALFLSMQLERCVQSAWGIPAVPARSGSSLARHWLALTLTPCAMALLGWVAYEALALAPQAEASWGASVGMLFGFFLISTWALPSARPPLAIAAFASALAAVECLGIQSAFGYAWSMSNSYGLIYGAAAAFLGALLWIWLFWLCLLSSVSVASTLFLARPRDLASNGLGIVEDCLLFFAPSASASASAPDPDPASILVLPEPLESQLLDQLGRDPSFCDPAAYLRALRSSPSLASRRAALGQACAARAAHAMIDHALACLPLANPELADKIPTAPPSDLASPKTP